MFKIHHFCPGRARHYHPLSTGSINITHYMPYPNDWRSDGGNSGYQTKQRVEHLCIFRGSALLLQWQQTHSTPHDSRPSALYPTGQTCCLSVHRRERSDRGTDSSMQKGLPTVWIMSKTVTDDIISSQTVNCRYQRRKDHLIGLADISLESEVHMPTYIQCVLCINGKLLIHMSYQYSHEGRNNRVL